MTAQPMITVNIRYFAIFREQRNEPGETLTVARCTPRDLFRRLTAEHGFTLAESMVRYAVNETFVSGDEPLQDGDELVFIPPLAGG